MNRMERADAMQEVLRTLSDDTIEAADEQAKKLTANMILVYGDKQLFTAAGVIRAIAYAIQSGLCWAAVEGLIEFTDAALASDDELKEREKRRAEYKEAKESLSSELHDMMKSQGVGQYL